MRARGCVLLLVAAVSTAAADPTPKPVDIKALKAKAVVLQDAQGGTYVIFDPNGDDPKIFFGPNAKTLYQQVVVGSYRNGDAWSYNLWAPRLAEMRYAELAYKDDKTYFKGCDGKDDAGLTQLTGAKASAVLDKSQFVTQAIIHVPHVLARDDSGIYYYVDRIAKVYGGKGFRVFVGRKGAMKQMALTDVASDSEGEVFSTKTGDLRLVRNHNESGKDTMMWVKGEKKTELVFLDTDVNSVVVFKDLGLYTFLGTLCDNI